MRLIAFVVEQPVARVGIGAVQLLLCRFRSAGLFDGREGLVHLRRPACSRCHRDARRSGTAKNQSAIHRRLRCELLYTGRQSIVREHIGDEVGVFLALQRIRIAHRHLAVHKRVQGLQAFVVPLRAELGALQWRRSRTLQLRTMTGRALRRVLPAAAIHLRLREPAGAISGCGRRRGRATTRLRQPSRARREDASSQGNCAFGTSPDVTPCCVGQVRDALRARCPGLVEADFLRAAVLRARGRASFAT